MNEEKPDAPQGKSRKKPGGAHKKDTAAVTTWIPQDVAAAIRAEAERQDRTVSWMVKRIICDHFQTRGLEVLRSGKEVAP